MGKKSATGLVAQIAGSRSRGLVRVLNALGIRHVGPRVAALLCERFPSIEQLQAASAEELSSVPEIGDIIAASVHEWLQSDYGRRTIAGLRDAGVRLDVPEAERVIDATMETFGIEVDPELLEIEKELAKLQKKKKELTKKVTSTAASSSAASVATTTEEQEEDDADLLAEDDEDNVAVLKAETMKDLKELIENINQRSSWVVDDYKAARPQDTDLLSCAACGIREYNCGNTTFLRHSLDALELLQF